MSNSPYHVKKLLETNRKSLAYYSLAELESQGHNISKLPFFIRILLENVLRNYDDFAVTSENIETILQWKPTPSTKFI